MPASPAKHDATLMWFRRDLRVTDNAALHAALIAGRRVYCVFVFDTAILAALNNRRNRRVEFIREAVSQLAQHLREAGGELIIRHGLAADEIVSLARHLKVCVVYANRDYEPAAKARDTSVGQQLAEAGIGFALRKDQTIFDGDEVLTGAGKPYTVFTPYKNAWLKRLQSNEAFYLKPYPVDKYLTRLSPAPHDMAAHGVPTLEQLGFELQRLQAPHRALPRGTRLSGDKRHILSVGASALWHHLDTRARGGGTQGGWRRRRHMAVGTHLA